jgi:hypothetical protein
MVVVFMFVFVCLTPTHTNQHTHTPTGQKADDIQYINWLNMCRAGLLALEFYSPETNRWVIRSID